MTQITLGQTDHHHSLKIDLPTLIDTRSIVCASSGGGKSWLTRLIVERTLGKAQVIIIDPEGEFKTLREKFDLLLVGEGGEIAPDMQSAKMLGRKLVEIGASAVIDLSFYDTYDERSKYLAPFLEGVMTAPRKYWHPILMPIDECHEFAPKTGERDSSQFVKRLAGSGRKRAIGIIAITQRISKLHNDVIAECKNVFIGGTNLNNDIERAADMLGMKRTDATRTLIELDAGAFFAYGPSFAKRGVFKFKTDQVITTHPKPGERFKLEVPEPSKAIKAIVGQMGDIAKQVQQEKDERETLIREVTDLKRQLTQRPTITVAAPQIVEREKPVITDAQLSDLNNAIEDITASNLNLISGLKTTLSSVNDNNEKTLGVLKEIQTSIRAITAQRPAQQFHVTTPRASTSPSFNQTTELLKGKVSILRALARCHPMHLTISQVSQLSSQSLKSSTFKQYIRDLKREFFIQEDHDGYKLTDAGMVAINFSPSYPQTPQEKIEMWRSALLAGELSIFDHVVSQHPDWVYIADISTATEQSLKSSTFKQYIRNLCRNKLFEKHGEKVRLNHGTFNN